MKEDTEFFDIEITGESTKKDYKGQFECKKLLTGAEDIVRLRKRREIAGGANFDSLCWEEKLLSVMYSDFFVYIVSAPDWWKKSNNGMDLKDDNVRYEVHDKISKITDKRKQEEEAEAENNKKALEESIK